MASPEAIEEAVRAGIKWDKENKDKFTQDAAKGYLNPTPGMTPAPMKPDAVQGQSMGRRESLPVEGVNPDFRPAPGSDTRLDNLAPPLGVDPEAPPADTGADTGLDYPRARAFMGTAGSGTPTEEGVPRGNMPNTEWLAKMRETSTETADQIIARHKLGWQMGEPLAEMGEIMGRKLWELVHGTEQEPQASPPAAMITPPAKR